MDPLFDQLPDEKILEICNMMNATDLHKFILTSKRNYQVCNEIYLKKRKEKHMRILKDIDDGYGALYFKDRGILNSIYLLKNDTNGVSNKIFIEHNVGFSNKFRELFEEANNELGEWILPIEFESKGWMSDVDTLMGIRRLRVLFDESFEYSEIGKPIDRSRVIDIVEKLESEGYEGEIGDLDINNN